MLLSGQDLALYIKERHARQVRSFKAGPVLVDIHASTDPATEQYLKTKQTYAKDIGVDFQIQRPKPQTNELLAAIKTLNRDAAVTGILVQLPLPENVDTDQVLAAINPAKDVDGLGPKAKYDPATPTGIMWLLAGHGINIKNQTVVVVGQGRLVGRPLADMLTYSGATVIRCDEHTKNLPKSTLQADILVTAAGQPNLIQPAMVKPGTVIIDAAGDASPALLEDQTLKITPGRGGVGPMTVAALFENLLRAAGQE